jgi:cyclic pyranopterin phosphate synthase
MEPSDDGTNTASGGGFIDPFGRRIEYVRLSVTDRCNLRCFYCLPKGFKEFEEPSHWLSYDEIERVMAAFGDLGVERIRLTGGEPLVRKGVPELAGRLARLPGIHDLSLSTNASLLARDALAVRNAGVTRINVSLDTLDPGRFSEITGGGDLQQVLDGLLVAREVGFKPIKINMVAMKGVNDDEFDAMLEFCMANEFTLRFIETMPMGDAGRSASDYYLNLDEVLAGLRSKYDLIPGCMPGGGPARYYQVHNTDTRIGFITPLSRHFCETCNRVRMAVDGTLYLCLGQDHSYPLRPLLRQGISHEGLKDAIIEALALKPERHEFTEKPGHVMRCMSLTGG